MERAKIQVKNINKIYNQGKKNCFTAIEDVSFNIDENEFVCIVGPSGCGKSTLLRMLAGLDFPTAGEILFDNEPIIGPSAQRGMVFQTYTLFPWMKVVDNIRYGLKLRKVPKDEQYKIAQKYLKIIGLEDFENSYPKQLSGGMKQRVAIARALANSPEALLMDEPFGALDPLTKASMQMLMRNIWQNEKKTVVFITHDIEEAVFLATKIYLMSATPGKIAAQINIDLPEDRDLDIKDTAEFIAIRKEISSMFYAKK